MEVKFIVIKLKLRVEYFSSKYVAFVYRTSYAVKQLKWFHRRIKGRLFQLIRGERKIEKWRHKTRLIAGLQYY